MAHGHVRRESVDTEMHRSGDQRKTFVYTKKRGYDVTRNPHLNKVSATLQERAGWCLQGPQETAALQLRPPHRPRKRSLSGWSGRSPHFTLC